MFVLDMPGNAVFAVFWLYGVTTSLEYCIKFAYRPPSSYLCYFMEIFIG